MKKLILLTLLLCFSIGLSTPVHAAKKEPAPEPTEIPAEVRIMLDRLEEIKAMDKSELVRAEKKALRKEVRAIKTQLRTTNRGIYISTGALIIIVLLILLL